MRTTGEMCNVAYLAIVRTGRRLSDGVMMWTDMPRLCLYGRWQTVVSGRLVSGLYVASGAGASDMVEVDY